MFRNCIKQFCKNIKLKITNSKLYMRIPKCLPTQIENPESIEMQFDVDVRIKENEKIRKSLAVPEESGCSNFVWLWFLYHF